MGIPIELFSRVQQYVIDINGYLDLSSFVMSFLNFSDGAHWTVATLAGNLVLTTGLKT